MKKQLSYLFIATISVGLLFSSCKKDKTNNNTDEATQLKTQSDDQARFSNETDAVANDANAEVENLGGSFNGETPITLPLPYACDATRTVDTTSTTCTITVTYTGTACLGALRTRSGKFIISFDRGFRWNTAGAKYKVTYQDLKITRLSDNKSITINGEKTITNVSGGRLRSLTPGSTNIIVHTTTSSGMSITFDDGSVRSWQVARRRTFTNFIIGGSMNISIEGIAPQGGGVAEWGTNRFGTPFSSAITQPLVLKQFVGFGFRLVSGQIMHTRLLATSTTTFGLNASGSPVNDYRGGVLYYKLVYTGSGGNTFTFIAPY